MSKEPIHSGHFMTSNPHSEISPDDEDEDVEVDVVDVDEGVSTAPLDKNAAKEKDAEKPVTFYKFGPQKTQSIAIDVSLNKLNKCIRVAYMKMTTPKWKDFKGIKLQWKHRIRLNNVIWRAYYMEFRKPGRKRRSPYCYFSVPDDDMTHVKIEGSVLEGMYWKRRMEAVCAQYKRWRAYFSRRKRCCRRRGHSCSCDQSTSNHHHLLIPMNESSSHHSQLLLNNQQFLRSMTPDNLSTMATECFLGTLFDFDDDMDNEFTNQLFEQLNAPFLFPNPKEETSVQCDNADILQPGLLSLQPSIEEIMSTDYPYGSSEYSSNQLPTTNQPIEYSNGLIENDGRGRLNTATTTLKNQSQQQQVLPSTRSQVPMHLSGNNTGIPLLQQQVYSEREYDAANMLINYSNQAQHLHLQQQQLSSSPSNKILRKHQKQQHLLETTTMSSSSSDRSAPFIEIQSAAIPQILTPNISNPLYSQAAAYETQRIAAALNSGGDQKNLLNSEISERQMKIGGGRNIYNNNNASLFPPTPMSKIANQTSTTHQIITSVASSSHPSHFSSPINYSLLAAAATTNAENQSAFNQQQTNLLNRTLTSTLSNPDPIISQWSTISWGSQRQQQPYPFLHQQSPAATTLVRKASENNLPTHQQQQSSLSINPPNISVRNFSTQSLLSSSNSSSQQQQRSFPSTNSSLVASLVSSTTLTSKNEQQQPSILSSHLLSKSLIEQKQSIEQQQQQKIDQSNDQLLQSLTEANNNASIGPQTVKRFVMSDISRYLAQQTPIITNSSLIQPSDKSAFVTGFGQTTSLTNCSLQNAFPSSISIQQQQQYSPSIINNIPVQINELKGTRGQKQHIQQQISPNSTNIPLSPPTKTAFSPPQQLLPRKMSVSISSAFSSPNNNLSDDNKKIRGSSFSSSSLLSSTNHQKQQRSQTTTTTHLGKRQQQHNNQINNLSPPQKHQKNNVAVENNNNVCLVAQTSTTNNNSFIDELEFASIGPVNIPSSEAQQLQQQQQCFNNTSNKRRNYKQLLSPRNSTTNMSPPIIIPSQQQQMQQPSYFKHLPPSNEAILLNSLIENNCNNTTINEELKQHKLLELGQFKQNLEVKKEDGIDNRNLEEKTEMCSPFSSTNDCILQDDNNLSPPYFSSSTTTILTEEEGSTLNICTNSAAADSTLNPDERKRILHLNAEKNRRSALKEGFDCLVKAIPLVEQAGLKSTNAVVLNRAAQHIKNLKLEQEKQLNQMKIFKEKIACMNERIAMIQANLPSSNLNGSKNNDNSPTIRIQVEQFFERYKRDKSQEDYRFWLMSEVIKPIVYSFAEQIYPDGTNRERLLLSTKKWLDVHWNSGVLRPIASDTLVRVATASGAFTNEQALIGYFSQQINQEVSPSSSSSSSTSLSQHSSSSANFVRRK